MGTSVITDWTNYSETIKQNYAISHSEPRETAIAEIHPTLSYIESQLDASVTNIENNDRLKHLISEKADLERYEISLDEVEGSQDFIYARACVNRDYETIEPNLYYYVILGIHYGDASRIAGEKARIEEQLDDFNLSSEQTDSLVAYEQDAYFCDYVYSEFEDRSKSDRRRYTWDGIQLRLDNLLRLTLAVGIAFILTGGVAGGLRKTEVIDIRTQLNSGIRRTLVTALKVTVAFGLVGGIVGIITRLLISGVPEGEYAVVAEQRHVVVPISLVVGLTIGLGLGFMMGGIDAVVKHLILRVFLMRSDSIPRNYAKLLDYLAERILLRKVGGGYIFIHRYLLEYFADLEKTSSGKRLDE